MRALSASECAGFAALDQHRAEALRVIGEDLLGDHVAGREPADDARAGHRRAARPPPPPSLPAASGTSGVGQVGGARLAEVAGQQDEQLVQVGDQRRVPVHLHAEVLEAWPRSSAAAIRRAAARTVLLGHAARARSSRRPASAAKCGSTCSRPSACAAEPVARDQVLLHEHADQRGEQQRVGAGLHLEVDVGDLGGLGAARIDHDQAARGVLRDLAQRDARARDAVREPRVLAEEERRPRSARSRRASSRRASSSATQNSPVFSCASALERMHRAEHARASRARTRRAGGSPGRRRRSRRSTRRRARRAPRRSAPRPRGSRCPSRSPRTCRRRGGAAASSGGAGRSGSSRGATASRTRSRARPGARRRRARARGGGRPAPPSCTSMPQLHSHRMQAVDFHSDMAPPEIVTRGSGDRVGSGSFEPVPTSWYAGVGDLVA